MYKKDLNVSRLGRTLNKFGLCQSFGINSSNNAAYGGYAIKDLVFQLDFVKGLSGNQWLDLVSKSAKATISGTFSTNDGVVLSSGAKVEMPSVEGVTYVEVCKKVGDTFETAQYASLIDQSFVGSIYAVRAYTTSPSEADKAKNIALDALRFEGAYFFDESFDNSFE